MRQILAALRPGPRKLALAAAIAAAVPLAAAGGANAAVTSVSTAAQLKAAITAANTNAGPDTIKLSGNTTFQLDVPVSFTDTTGATTVTSDHTLQAPLAGGPTISGVASTNLDADLITINAGVSVNFQGFTITAGVQNAGFGTLKNLGSLKLDSMLISNNQGPQLSLEGPGIGAPASAKITNTTIARGQDTGIQVLNAANVSPLTLTNSDLVLNTSVGIDAGGLDVQFNNTLVTGNTAGNCLNVGAASGATTSFDTDGSCPGTTQKTTAQVALSALVQHGGPTFSYLPGAASQAINAGTAALCPAVDQRFFVRSGACDIGAIEVGATQDTTAPSCTVTGLVTGPPKQQLVTLQDSGSGIYDGSVYTTTNSTPGPGPIPSIPTNGGLAISNGSIAFTPAAQAVAGFPASVGPTGAVVLTATKTDQAQQTRWAFSASDWAGNTSDCR